ncbi:MAG: isocitrate/isopropylmalate dehydrogenase family protein [Candidatus Heimdallarchaeota archaeon]|nr:isocitrate/isopropylmalate dehydrogenase family protein [Candidatus Heimdallarchaeota archaeon]
MSKQYKIGFLPGDGIGVDVLEASKAILDVADFNAEYIPLDIGFMIFENEGDALPARTVEALKECDAALFGAITSKPRTDPSVQKVEKKFGVTYRSPIVRLRQIFDLYSNMRPSKSYEGNPLNFRKSDGTMPDIDIVTFRENTEGLYAGIEFESLVPELKGLPNFKAFQERSGAKDEDIRISCRVFTRKGCERIIRKAFEYAKTTGRDKVTVIHKANVIRATDGLFLEKAHEISKKYPNVEWWDENIDAVCMWMMKRPEAYSVIVSSNMFGDIITDQAAMLSGGLGFAASASTSEKFGVFEPNHGSAPKYAGQNKVNPIAAIKSIVLMWDYLGLRNLSIKLEQAIAQNVMEGKIRTYDMGGTSSTTDVANDIARIFGEK